MAKTTSIALALALEEEAKRRRETQEAQIRRDESLAERFAEPDLRREQIELLQTERRLGAPEITEGRIPSEDRLSFTDPRGFRHEFWPGGTLRSTTFPTTLSNDYTPRDQKKIQDLYQQRSDIATNPELNGDEDARQAALDEIDASISRIPLLPPILREPTAQQQFDTALVRGPNGQMGTWDGKKFSPIEESKGAAAKQAKWIKDYQFKYNEVLKDETGDNPDVVATRYADHMALATTYNPALVGRAKDLEQDPFAFGLRRGEGTVTVEDETAISAPAPTGLESIWPKLNDENRAEAVQALQAGHSAKAILAEYKKNVGSK